MIQAEHLSKRYGKDFWAVRDLSFQIHKGEIVGFVGQNGAGKTTTIKMLSGILNPTEGQITICGCDMEKEAQKAKKCLGYVADNPDLFLRLTGREFIHFLADIYDIPVDGREERMAELTERFAVTEALDKPMSDYSHGMRQKMMIIAALVHQPPVWVLDEPMTGLDPKAAFELKQMMREHARAGNCVFFSTHVLEVAEKLCDRIIILKDGAMEYEGTLETLTKTYEEKSLEEIFLLLSRKEMEKKSGQ